MRVAHTITFWILAALLGASLAVVLGGEHFGIDLPLYLYFLPAAVWVGMQLMAYEALELDKKSEDAE